MSGLLVEQTLPRSRDLASPHPQVHFTEALMVVPLHDCRASDRHETNGLGYCDSSGGYAILGCGAQDSFKAQGWPIVHRGRLLVVSVPGR